MFSAELINLDNADHAGFIYDLINECRAEFLSDFEDDELLVIAEYRDRIKNGQTVGFLGKVDGQPIGAIWVDIDRYKIGNMYAGAIPQYRGGIAAYRFLKQFIEFCFESMDLRKLEAKILFRGRTKNTPERLVRKLGFKKQGMDWDSTLINGESVDHLVFALTKTKYLENKHG